MKHISIILRTFIYTMMTVCTIAAIRFADEGAAKLQDYKFTDWLVLLVAIGAGVFTNLNAYFDRSFGTHVDELKKEKEDGQNSTTTTTTTTQPNQTNTMKPTIPTLLICAFLAFGVCACTAFKSAVGGVTQTTQTTASNIVEVITIPLR